MASKTAWDQLGEELLARDQWGDFVAARSHPGADWLKQNEKHPVNLLLNTGVPRDRYVDILIASLETLTPDLGLEMVVRCLTRKDFKQAVEPLLNLFDHDQHLKSPSALQMYYAASNAIYHINVRRYLDRILPIAHDRRFGFGRGPLIIHLSRFKKSDEAFEAMIAQLDDESVRGHALDGLKRFGDPRAIPFIERTPVRDGDEGVYETHQKEMALKKLKETL